DKAVANVKNIVRPNIEDQRAVANHVSYKEESGRNTDEIYNEFINQVLKKKINADSERDPDLNYLAQYDNPKDPTTARQLSELIKIYFDESKKFSGDLFDILDTKLRIFFDQCRNVGLPGEHLTSAYSLMLKGKAADYYYAYLSERNYDFVSLIQATKDHFETKHNRQEYLSLWRETTFLHIINKNSYKDRNDCLEILFNTLSRIQQGLCLVYLEKHRLRDQVLDACRGIPECKMTLMKLSPTYEGVCADLRSAISNETKCSETLQFLNSNEYNINANGHSNGNHRNDGNNHKDNEVNWTDRTYCGHGKDNNNFRQNTRGSYQNNSRRYRPESYENNQNQRQKKFFTCQKVGCWSIRHLPEERKQAATKWQHTAISCISKDSNKDGRQSV
ncbi:integrase and RNaseH domain-containing protein, partial [Golovinomyces cichoracearum]